MGDHMQKLKNDEEEKFDKFEIKRIYWDNDGNLRHGRTDRSRDNEIISLLQNDTCDEKDMTKLWMIVPSRWVRQWLLFAHVKLGDPPGPIDMLPLLKNDKTYPGGWRPKNSLLPPSTKFGEERPGHYRRISLQAWLELVDLYGVDGYAIAVRGYPYDDITRWRVFKDPKNIDINLLPEPVLPEEQKEEKKEESTLNNAANALMSIGSSLFGGGGGGNKTK